MPGTLYLIPNALGTSAAENSDPFSILIPQQVQSITAQLTFFIAENAKSTRTHLKLIARQHPLARPIQDIQIEELNVNTPQNRLPALLTPLRNGHDVGLISEAGVPAVADPGANIVQLAHIEGIRTVPLVGPSSILLALMASGLNGQSFAFNGYLPTDQAAREKRIIQLENRSRTEKQTQIFIETPYRNLNLWESLASTCQPQTLVTIAYDITLDSEVIQTRTAKEWKEKLLSDDKPNIHKRPCVFLLLA